MTALRGGYTTGTCAAAAAKAAALLLATGEAPTEITVALPDGERVTLPVQYARLTTDGAEAAVRKDAGDDPDVTHGSDVVARVEWIAGSDVQFAAGEGVGMVTKPGLQVPPGEPAINPVPRRMIAHALREVTGRVARVTISVPGGTALAEKTFNPRLGIVGGISILGTSGRVRPFSAPALQDALRCALDVAAAAGVTAPVLTPGNIGEQAVRRHFRVTQEQIILVSNEWGFMLDTLGRYSFARLLAAGHPGKLAKLAAGEWDTHSSRSSSAVPFVTATAESVLGRAVPQSVTVEGLLEALPDQNRARVAERLAEAVQQAVRDRTGGRIEIAVALANMRGSILGTWGDLGPWQ